MSKRDQYETCKTDGCGKPVRLYGKRGYCQYCYKKGLKSGAIERLPLPTAEELEERRAAALAAYRATHKEELAAKAAAYYAANREKLNAVSRAYRAAHKEKIAAQRAAFWVTNKERLSADIAAYRKRMKEQMEKEQMK